MAQHLFRGLRRDMWVGDDSDAASEMLAATWAAKRDAQLIGKHDCELEFFDPPRGRVFVVYITVNRMLEAHPDIYGNV